MRSRLRLPRLDVLCTGSGVQISIAAPRFNPEKRGGATPTTVSERPSSTTCDPTADGEPPNVALAPGPHVVEVTSTGFLKESFRVTITEGGTTRRSITLQAVPKTQAPSVDDLLVPDSLRKKKTR